MITSRQLIRNANAAYHNNRTSQHTIRSRLIVLESSGKLNARHQAERIQLHTVLHHMTRLDNTNPLCYAVVSDSPIDEDTDSFLGEDD